MNACPHCGDTKAGYEFRAPVTDIRVGIWGKGSESAELVAGDFPKTVVCQSCKKRVPTVRAEGIEP